MRRVIRTKHLVCVGDAGDGEYGVFLRREGREITYAGSLFEMPKTTIEIMREWDEIAEIVFEEETKRIEA